MAHKSDARQKSLSPLATFWFSFFLGTPQIKVTYTILLVFWFHLASCYFAAYDYDRVNKSRWDKCVHTQKKRASDVMNVIVIVELHKWYVNGMSDIRDMSSLSSELLSCTRQNGVKLNVNIVSYCDCVATKKLWFFRLLLLLLLDAMNISKAWYYQIWRENDKHFPQEMQNILFWFRWLNSQHAFHAIGEINGYFNQIICNHIHMQKQHLKWF